jgi:hypothetical protein
MLHAGLDVQLSLQALDLAMGSRVSTVCAGVAYAQLTEQ